MRKAILLILTTAFSFNVVAQKENKKMDSQLIEAKSVSALQEQINVVQQQNEAILQNAEATKATTEKVEREIEELKNNLSEFKSKISDEDRNTEIGVIKLNKQDQVDIYEFNDESESMEVKEQLDIDSIRIETIDGFITSVMVYCEDDNKIFMNYNAPITLSNKRFNNVEYLKCYYKGAWKYMKISDFLSYKPIRNYIPDNSIFSLNKDNKAHTFNKGVGINTIFDLRLYTDAFAALGSKPNGLITTEAYFRQVLHRYNFSNLGVYAFSNLKINFNVSKFDSKITFVDSSDFSRTALFQRSWLNTDISVSVLKGWLAKRSVSSWYIDAGAGLSLSKLAGSNDTSDITSTFLFIQPGADLNVSDNIGVTFSSRIMYHYSPQINFNNQGGERVFIRPTVGFFWNPLGNESSRIFARLMYTVETSDREKHYPQFQFGYALKLSSLAK